MEEYGHFVDIEHRRIIYDYNNENENKIDEYVNEFMLFSVCYNLFTFYLKKYLKHVRS